MVQLWATAADFGSVKYVLLFCLGKCFKCFKCIRQEADLKDR